jgi:arabinose-5-phosphate isomerase
MIKYFDEILDTCRDSIHSLDETTFNELIDYCTDCIKNGGKIVASGLGKNVPICEKFVGTMNSLGMDARFLHTNTAVHGDLGMVGKNDIVLLLSKSGNTVESVMLAEYLNERGTETWLMSFNENCKLAKILDKKLILQLKNEGDPWDIVPNNSTTLYLILLQGLAMQICDRMGITLADFKVNHPGGGIGAKLRGETL